MTMHHAPRLTCIIFLAVLLVTAQLLAADESKTTSYRANDSIGVITDTNSDAQECLQSLMWERGEFQVTCETKPGTPYDHLVRFPSPLPSGDLPNDMVAMEWYAATNREDGDGKTPAVLVVHESGRSMPVGRLVARGLQAAGFHAFLIHLPHYGQRSGDGRGPESGQLFLLIRQAIADVRRGRDAIAVLPGVDASLISLQGTSLGGFVVATVGSLDRAFTGVFITLAGGNLYEMLLNGQKDTAQARQELEEQGISGDKLKNLLWKIEPTRVAHRLDPDRTWMHSADQDQVVPIDNALALARAAHLAPEHHVRISANHYTAILFFPVILQHMTDQLRMLETEPTP
jgi:dienelactone hydrolase